jgi:hypothetical protein
MAARTKSDDRQSFSHFVQTQAHRRKVEDCIQQAVTVSELPSL